jgi:hypothetical protein
MVASHVWWHRVRTADVDVPNSEPAATEGKLIMLLSHKVAVIYGAGGRNGGVMVRAFVSI